MTNGLIMAGYIDDLNEEEMNATGQGDDMDIPLLNTNTIDETLCNPLCLYHQPGFAGVQNDDSNKDARLKIILATVLCTVFMITEFVGGYFAGSLAIMTDAAHLMSDCISFVIGLLAIWISNKPADRKMSFGYKRMEVLGAIMSILGIWFLTALLFYMAIDRIITNDFEIDADTMMIVAGIGIVINIIMAFILHGSFSFHSHGHSHSHTNGKQTTKTQYDNHLSNQPDSQIPTFVVNHENSEIRPRQGSITIRENQKQSDNNSYPSLNRRDGNAHSHEVSFNEILHSHSHSHSHDGSSSKEENLNLRAALIHVFGDFVQSIGVFVAAVVIKFYPNAKLADPLCTLLFSIIVMLTTVKIIKESISVIMDAVPNTICIAKLETDLTGLEGVKSVHHLNVWSQTINHNLMMAHITIDEFSDSNLVLKNASNLAKSKYNIKHSTLQIERYHSHGN